MNNKKQGLKRLEKVYTDFLYNKITETEARKQDKLLRKKYKLNIGIGTQEKPYLLNFVWFETLEKQVKKIPNAVYEKRELEGDLLKVLYRGKFDTSFIYFKLPKMFFKRKIYEYTFHYLNGVITVKKFNQKIESFKIENIQGYCDFQNICFDYLRNLKKD